ncbi:hypothetical protein [Enterococcus sp. N249-2]
MFFSSLENSKSSIPESYIELLDHWLGTMTSLYHKKINPRDFSLQNGMDIEFVLKLFDIAVEKDVLLPKIIVTNDEKVPFGTYYNVAEIPDFIEDFENNTDFEVKEHNLEVWYELIAVPKDEDVSDSYFVNNDSENAVIRPTLDVLKKSGASTTMRKIGMTLKNWEK